MPSVRRNRRDVAVGADDYGVGIADGISRSTSGKKIGVFAMQGGPGIENAYPGVAQVFGDNVPVLIAIFAQKYGITPDGERYSHYYVPESVGIATGFLISALHHCGLATLTHTPSPMGFLNSLCGRPDSEKAVILLVVGHPKPDCMVPVHGGIKKPLASIHTWR